MAVKKKNILFICKYNRFRSKIAEAVFKKHNKNKNIRVKSAGIIKGAPLNRTQKLVGKKMGYPIGNPPQGMSTSLLKWQDTLVIVANDVPASLFKDNRKYGKKLIVWKIPDDDWGHEKNIEKIIKKIEKKVKKFVRKLK